MGRLDTSGLQRLVKNIKESVINNINTIESNINTIESDINTIESDINIIKTKTSSYDTVVKNFKNISFSVDLPTDDVGNDGDIWIKYIQE